MSYTTLISAEELGYHLDEPDWVIIDCRFDSEDTDRGRKEYEQAHIPGAVYAHLDKDLAGPIIPGQTGRHPLPDDETFVQTLSSWGIDSRAQVVVYDELTGAYAARLWWMLRWIGHEAVAVLDGGWTHWREDGYPVRAGNESRPNRDFTPAIRNSLVASTADVETMQQDPLCQLLDARSPERFRGEEEPFDPVAGHIPGAESAYYGENLRADGRFLSPEQLRQRFEELLGDTPPEKVVIYCGSGVTAAHNILAMAYAGLELPSLYVGSWSQWTTDPNRSIETE